METEKTLLDEIREDFKNPKPKPVAPKKPKSKWRTAYEVTIKTLAVLWRIVSSKLFMYFCACLAVVSFFAYVFVVVTTFLNSHETVFQNPLPWSFETRTPVYWVEKKPIEILVPVTTVEVDKEHLGTKASEMTEADKVAMIMEKSEFPKQLLKIRTLESSNGKKDIDGLHTFCESVGMTNEFGFDPFAVTGNRCFATYEDSIKAVDQLLSKLLEKYSLNEAICIYNTGKGTECTYLANYKAL